MKENNSGWKNVHEGE